MSTPTSCDRWSDASSRASACCSPRSVPCAAAPHMHAHTHFRNTRTAGASECCWQGQNSTCRRQRLCCTLSASDSMRRSCRRWLRGWCRRSIDPGSRRYSTRYMAGLRSASRSWQRRLPSAGSFFFQQTSRSMPAANAEGRVPMWRKLVIGMGWTFRLKAYGGAVCRRTMSMDAWVTASRKKNKKNRAVGEKFDDSMLKRLATELLSKADAAHGNTHVHAHAYAVCSMYRHMSTHMSTRISSQPQLPQSSYTSVGYSIATIWVCCIFFASTYPSIRGDALQLCLEP